MKRLHVILVVIGLSLAPAAVWSFSGSCSAYYDCSCSADISCTISAAPGNSVNCWTGPGAQITCCEFNAYGTPIRDIHKSCGSCGPGGPGGGPKPPFDIEPIIQIP